MTWTERTDASEQNERANADSRDDDGAGSVPLLGGGQG